MKFHKYLALLLLVYLAAFLPNAYGQQQLRQAPLTRLQLIRQSGVLRIGVPGDYAPFAIVRGDSLYGADIRMAHALAAAMGVKPVFVKTSWSALSADMQNNRFDIALGGISVTPARAKLAVFSVPYHRGGKTFLCRRADSAKFSQPADVNKPAVRLIVNHGGTNESVAKSMFPFATLIVFPNNTGVFDEIINGHADVMLTDDTEADLKALQYPQLCRSFPGTIDESGKAIWIQDDGALVNFINRWMRNALAAGQPQKWLKDAMVKGNR